MYQMPFPYMENPPFPQQPQQSPWMKTNLQQELERLNREIKELKKRVAKLEQSPTNDYLKKEDGMYMI